jgi:hypothetical protein
MAKRNSTTLIAPSSIPSEGKYTCYNRETMDYDGFFNGQYLGSRENMNAARDMVNEYVYDLERGGEMYTAEQLDGGASESEDVTEISPLRQAARILDQMEAAAAELVMTDAPARTMEDIDRAQINAWNGMDQDERLFASAITGMMNKVKDSHRAMMQAGIILIAAACDGIGPEDDGDEEKAIAARIHHAAFTAGHQEGYDKGLKDGMEGCLLYLEKKMMERKAVAA